MSIAQSLLPEFDQEMKTTRKILERIPETPGWKPHAKSFSIGDLALHVANLPTWTKMTLDLSELEINPPGGFKRPVFSTTQAMVADFDRNVKEAREALSKASDQQLMEPWTLIKDGVRLFTLPKVAVLRSWVMNHLIHHRGQLSVYLRLNDIAVPGVYGPSADEPM